MVRFNIRKSTQNRQDCPRLVLKFKIVALCCFRELRRLCLSLVPNTRWEKNNHINRLSGNKTQVKTLFTCRNFTFSRNPLRYKEREGKKKQREKTDRRPEKKRGRKRERTEDDECAEKRHGNDSTGSGVLNLPCFFALNQKTFSIKMLLLAEMLWSTLNAASSFAVLFNRGILKEEAI